SAVDPLRLEQVVSNLLSNAIKYSPRGGAVHVELENGVEHVVLSVADEGIGISPDQRAEIFLPFRPRRADAPAGAGLGLSVVRRIIERSEEHTSELQSRENLVCRLLLVIKKNSKRDFLFALFDGTIV